MLQSLQMTEKKEVKPNIQQMDDHYPLIVNCRGGLDGANLYGRLTDEEIENVKRLPMLKDIRDQLAVFKPCDCSKKGKTTIAYYPREREISLISEEINPIIVVQALCLNIACKHNVDSPAKK